MFFDIYFCPLAPTARQSNSPEGSIRTKAAIQSTMKQPTDQEERNEDKKKPEQENPSHGIDPESKEPEMEVQDPGEQKKENQNQKTDDPRAA